MERCEAVFRKGPGEGEEAWRSGKDAACRKGGSIARSRPEVAQGGGRREEGDLAQGAGSQAAFFQEARFSDQEPWACEGAGRAQEDCGERPSQEAPCPGQALKR